MKPLCIDLFCGLGGWSEGFLAEGYRCVGFDIVRHRHNGQQYPGHLMLQDVLTIHGSQFRDAAVIVASPPCQQYSWLAMPWSRSSDPNNSKAAKALRARWEAEGPDNRLFDACFRIQREACEAAGKDCPDCEGWAERRTGHECSTCNGTGEVFKHIPLIVENVRGAQEWVGKRDMPLAQWNALSKAERYWLGRSQWNHGSFHLWGDVPALMPITSRRFKRAGRNFHAYAKSAGAVTSPSFHGADHETRGVQVTKNTGQKTVCHVNQRDGHSHTRHLTNQAEHDAVKVPGLSDGRFPPGGLAQGALDNGLKIGGDWFRDPACHSAHSSRSNARKEASALIAKIPFALSSHIAQVYKPK